jgi:hypothetical protein
MEILLVVILLLVGVLVVGVLAGQGGHATTTVVSPPTQPLAARPADPDPDSFTESADEAFVLGYVIGRHVGDERGHRDDPQPDDRDDYGLDADECFDDDWFE